MTKQEQLIDDAIQMNPLFKYLALDKSFYSVQSFSRGQNINALVEEKVCLVFDGQLQVINESKVIVSVLKEGSCFGINDLYLKQEEEKAVICCVKNTSLISINKALYKSLMESSSQTMVEYAKLCNQKIHFLLSRIKELTAVSAKDKVLSYIQTHHKENGEIDFGKSKESLAKVLNISRAALFAQLKDLEEQKIIKVVDKKSYLQKENNQ